MCYVRNIDLHSYAFPSALVLHLLRFTGHESHHDCLDESPTDYAFLHSTLFWSVPLPSEDPGDSSRCRPSPIPCTAYAVPRCIVLMPLRAALPPLAMLPHFWALPYACYCTTLGFALRMFAFSIACSVSFPTIVASAGTRLVMSATILHVLLQIE